MTELLGGLELAGSLFKLFSVYLLVQHLRKGRTLPTEFQRIGSGYVMIVFIVWTIEGTLTGLLPIYGEVFANMTVWTIIWRAILYFLLLIWDLLYIVIFPLEGREVEELHLLE